MPVQPCALAARPTTPRFATPPPGAPSARWPMSKLPAPTIWPATIRLRARLEQLVTFASVKQPASAARAVRADRLRPRVQVQQVGVRDQLELDRHVLLVDLADAVDQRHLRRGHVGRAAAVVRVARIGDQRELVGAEHVAGRRVGGRVVRADDLVARRRRVVAARVARLDDVRLEVAVGIGDERLVEVAGAVGLHAHRPVGEDALRVGDRDRDERVRREAAAATR